MKTTPDLRKRIKTVLETSHVGRHRAIKSRHLAQKAGSKDRAVRAAISDMRKDGELILGAILQPYGFFIADSFDEYEHFRHTNLRPRALDILQTDKAMLQAANERWAVDPDAQLSLFDDWDDAP